ncbi:cold shock and DUF1294 domain-containing protein [soil metagenome]
MKRFEGILRNWDDNRGFGFIDPAHGGPAVFAHVKAFDVRTVRPQVGQKLSYLVETDAQGKQRAVRIQVAWMAPVRRQRRYYAPDGWRLARHLAIPLFVALYLALAMLRHVPAWVAGLYAAASLICFSMYAADKSAARSGQWRVSESTLLWAGFFCGWPGAIVAQEWLRHKSKKTAFRAAFWRSVVFNITVFVGLCFLPVGAWLAR